LDLPSISATSETLYAILTILASIVEHAINMEPVEKIL